MTLLIIQWTLFLSSLLIYLLGAAFNGYVAWLQWIKKDPDGPSIAPLIAGAIGVVAVLSAPIGELTDRIPYIWIPMLFDCGTIPYFLLVVVTLIKKN